MGWWAEAISDEELMLGDEPLDVAGELLDQLVLLYERDVRRKPKLAELAKTLYLALVPRVDNLLNNPDEVELAEVIIKLRKRPKKQKISPGDFIAIPLPSGGYGYGQIRRIFRPSVLLINFFELYSESVLPMSGVVGARVLFEALTGYLGLMNWEWRVIGNVVSPGVDISEPAKGELEKEINRLLQSFGYLTVAKMLDDKLRMRRKK